MRSRGPRAGRWGQRVGAALAGSLLVLLVIVAGAPVAAGELRLEGEFIQGALVRGFAEPGSHVSRDGIEVRVSPDGLFLIGFDRDEPSESALEIRYPDGSVETRNLEIATREYDIERIDGLPDRMVTPGAEDLERIRAEAAGVRAARAGDTAEAHFAGGFVWPAHGRISGVFGSQRILNGEPRRPHYGVDVAAPVGTPVWAAGAGVVVFAESDLYFTGGTVIIDHGHGLTTAYSHLSRVDVEPGQALEQGDVIGAVGATGRVTGAHLDWRLNLFKRRLDPTTLVGPMPD